MMRKRLLWIAAITLSAALYLFENNWGTLTLLVGVLVLPVFGLLFLTAKKITVSLNIRAASEKGSSALGQLTLCNLSFLPAACLRLQLSCKNLRTGEETLQNVQIGLLPKQSKQLEFSVECPYCGKGEICICGATVSDLFGMFTRKIALSCGTEFSVLPTLFEPTILFAASDMASVDSDRYSPVKPGNDPGETFAIREYVAGDEIRRIHWKLSEKTDKTMVRDFGLPLINEVALLLESASADTPAQTDAMTEVFASLSSALLRCGIAHHVLWRGASEVPIDYCVESEADHAAMLAALLELTPTDGDLVRDFTQMYPHCPYSHVIFVGSQIPQDIATMYNGNRVSVLLPRTNGISEGLQPDGCYVLSFDTEHYADELCRVEV